MITKQSIMEAYLFLRKNNSSIPDETLEFMKDAALSKLEENEDLKRMAELQGKGHSPHCACRQVYGDGECECDLYQKGYNPYAWEQK